MSNIHIKYFLIYVEMYIMIQIINVFSFDWFTFALEYKINILNSKFFITFIKHGNSF